MPSLLPLTQEAFNSEKSSHVLFSLLLIDISQMLHYLDSGILEHEAPVINQDRLENQPEHKPRSYNPFQSL